VRNMAFSQEKGFAMNGSCSPRRGGEEGAGRLPCPRTIQARIGGN
jgi:hypothetical protein